MITHIALLFLLFLAWFMLRRKWMTLLKRCGIPGPEPHFIFGHLPEYASMGNLEFQSDLIARYGPIVGYYLGAVPYVLVADQDLLQKIQITDSKLFLRRPRRIPDGINPDPRRRKMLGHLPVEDWMKMRKVLSHGFSPSKIRYHTGEIQNNVDILLRKLDEILSTGCSEINFVELYEKFSLDIILETTFGYSLNIQEQSKPTLLQSVRAKFNHPTLTKGVWLSLCLPELMIIIKPLRIIFHQLKVFLGLDESFVWQTSRNAIIRRINKPDSADISDELQVLLNGKISFDQIAAYGVHALQGGYETITSTLGFVTSLLAQHQDVQNKVREEVMSLSQQKQSGYNEFLSGLKYLDFVIAEALRLWPQTTFIRRTPSEMYQFTKDGSTYTFPKGIHIQIGHYQVHHSDDNWPDSDVFNPERFEDKNQVKLSLNNPKWQAFGCGPRHCMGYKLASLVLKATIASIVEKYVLTPVDAATEINTVAARVTSTVDPKDPVWVKVSPLE